MIEEPETYQLSGINGWWMALLKKNHFQGLVFGYFFHQLVAFLTTWCLCAIHFA